MGNIFSNRFVQGGIAIAVIGIAFFTYQNFAGEVDATDAEVTTAEISNESSATTTTTTEEGKIAEASQDNIIEDAKTENAVNNASSNDNINTAAGETTNQ